VPGRHAELASSLQLHDGAGALLASKRLATFFFCDYAVTIDATPSHPRTEQEKGAE